MNNTTSNKTSIREKLALPKEEQPVQKGNHDNIPGGSIIKTTGIVLAAVAVLWTSGFIFNTLGYSIKSFKKMMRDIKQ